MTNSPKTTPTLIGIAGGSGSGKTTLVTALHERLGADKSCIMGFDWYYKVLSHLRPVERDGVNFDHPDSLDVNLFVDHLRRVKTGQTVEAPIYDFTTHLRQSQTRRVASTPVVLVEGILLLALDTVRTLLDVKVFIDTPADIRFIRRLTRDIQERGRTVDYGIQQYLIYTRPMHNTFVEPSKRFADIVVSGEEPINTLTVCLLKHLKDCYSTDSIQNL